MNAKTILTMLVAAALAVAPSRTFATNHELGTFGGTRTISGTITSNDNISTLGIYLGGTGTYINPQTLANASTSYAHNYSFTAAASGTAYISSFSTSHSKGDGSVSLYASATSTVELYNAGTGALPVTKGARYNIRVSSVRAYGQTFSFTLTAPGSSSGSSSYSSSSSSSSGTASYVSKSARTMTGAAYRDSRLAGTVTLKLGKTGKNGVYKVSGTFLSLAGKRHTIRAANVTATTGVDTVSGLTVNGLGTMSLKLGTSSFTGTTSDGMTLKSANISSLPVQTMTFKLAHYLTSVNGVAVLTDYLPLSQAVSSNGKKLTTPKGGKLTYRKGSLQLSAGGEGNPSGLRLTYATKTGQIKGSFNVYTFNGQKLKKYTARVCGVAANGVARMIVTIGRLTFSEMPGSTLR